MSVSSDAISALEQWYASQCNGDWEHGHGVRIDTLDNPGWSISIGLHDTPKANSHLDRQKIERTDNDWIHYRVEHRIFEIRCGLLNLSEAIYLFLRWFDS